MKKFNIIALLVCMFLNTACESDDTLNETRVPDVTAPSVSLESVTVNKYDAAFKIKLNDAGNPATREYGVLISEDAQPTTSNSMVLAATDVTETEANFSRSLSPGTTYYVCAYALTANKLITSEVKQFATDPHLLGAFLGSKTLSGFNLHSGEVSSIAVTLSPDDEDDTVAYLTGLSSNAGVQLPLGPIKLVFDLEAGTVTIPDGQIISETKYGNYRYVAMDEDTNAVMEDIVGTIDNRTISFDSLAAIIIAGGNSGLFHWAFFEITVQ